MDQQLPKPADVLLHYNYGAAVVKQWGKGDRVPGVKGGLQILRCRTNGMRMISCYFSGVTQKVALERHAQEKQELTAYVEDWRTTVMGNPPIVE